MTKIYIFKSFAQQCTTKTRLKSIHTICEKTFKCESCGKLSVTKQENQRHIELVHEGRRDYKCDSCGKFYQTKNALNIHTKLVHAKIRDNHCNYCTKSFSLACHLKRHILEVHKGIKIRRNKKKTD